MSRTAVEVTKCTRCFDSAAAAKNRLLLLDCDGTVAPFYADRRRALPYPIVPELLHEIMTSCRTPFHHQRPMRLYCCSAASAGYATPDVGHLRAGAAACRWALRTVGGHGRSSVRS